MIAIDGSGPPAALKLVSDAGVPLTMIHDDPSPDGVAAKIETIGKLLGAEEKAVTLANETRARFALVEHMRPQTPKPPRVLFILSLQNGRPMVGGRGTAADAIIRLAGGANAADAIEGYKPMTDEGVIAAAPDVILKMNNGNMVGGKDDIFALPAFSATPAAANRTLIGMDWLYLLGFGPRSPDAVRELMADLYPNSHAAAAADARRPAVSVSIRRDPRRDPPRGRQPPPGLSDDRRAGRASDPSSRCFRSPMALSRSRADESPASSSARLRRAASIRRRTPSSSFISDCHGSSSA